MRHKTSAKLALAALLLAAPAAHAQQVEIQMGRPAPEIRIDDTARQEELRRREELRRQDYSRLREIENEQWQRERQQAIREGHGTPSASGREREAQRGQAWERERDRRIRETINRGRAFEDRQQALQDQQRALDERQRALNEQRRALEERQRATSEERSRRW
jgi:mRNA degradation ribonuclease J1/J2